MGVCSLALIALLGNLQDEDGSIAVPVRERYGARSRVGAAG